MAFLRAARNPSKMAKSLIPAFTSGDRLDLFRLWLQHSRDFAKVEVEVNRRNIQKKEATAKDSAKSRHELETCGKYTKEDVAELIKRKTATGQFIEDPNFPGREDLRLYLVNSEVSQASSSIREDVQSINTRGGATTDEAMTLIEDGADFSSTALPTIQEVLGGTPPEVPQGQPDAKGKGKGKRTRKTKGKQTEGQVNENENTKPEGEQQGDKVPTPLEKAMALKKAVLKESEEARTLCVSIEGLECAGELVKALTAHAGAMVKLYRQLHQYTIQNVNDQSVYDPIFDQATSYTSWFKARKKVANSMKQAAEKSAPSKKRRVDDVPPSELAREMLWDVSRGELAMSTMQRYANAAYKDGLDDETIMTLASLANWGRHPSNTEREFHRAVPSLFGTGLSPYCITIEVYNPDEGRVLPINIPVLLASDVLHELWKKGSPQLWDICVGATAKKARAFWSAFRDDPAFRDHPVMQHLGENDAQSSYPVLDSSVKAAHTKPILFFLAEISRELSEHCNCIGCRDRAMVLYGCCDFLWATDRPAFRLGAVLQQRGLESGVLALTSYSALSARNLQKKRKNYKVRPKWHSWCHLIHGLRSSDENIRNHKTLAEEDCLGKLCQLASAVHGGCVIRRFFDRYRLFLAMHFERLQSLPPEQTRAEN
ncbi:Nipped-B-like protein B [Durusdinium trenchii]|uniref:Nipped-B-like protein B n=1 Tax=Durusdinium trenchii TaxID=1381693 RepID=A0ABP0JVV0_9DINO